MASERATDASVRSALSPDSSSRLTVAARRASSMRAASARRTMARDLGERLCATSVRYSRRVATMVAPRYSDHRSLAKEKGVPYCATCGNAIPRGAAFCPSCGAAVAAPSRPSEEPVVTPEPSRLRAFLTPWLLHIGVTTGLVIGGSLGWVTERGTVGIVTAS